MIPSPANSGNSLQIQRTYDVPREEVYQAWIDPAVLREWFCLGPDYISTVAEVDLRIGGRYRLGMRHIEKGIEHVATGLYREIVPGKRLVFTWSWEGESHASHPETLVTVEFHDREGATEIALSHDLFATPTVRDEHGRGWSAVLDALGLVLAKRC